VRPLDNNYLEICNLLKNLQEKKEFINEDVVIGVSPEPPNNQ
jgi:hypothetical protein